MECLQCVTSRGLQDSGSAKDIVVETVEAFSLFEVGVEHELETVPESDVSTPPSSIDPPGGIGRSLIKCVSPLF